EEDVDVAWREFRQFRAKTSADVSRHERIRVRQRRSLLLNRAHDPLVAVTGVHTHQLAVEIEITLAIGSPEVDALGPRHRDRIDRTLRRPFEHRVSAAEINDFAV